MIYGQFYLMVTKRINSEPQKQKTDFAAYKSYPLKDNNFIIMDRYEKGWSFLFIL